MESILQITQICLRMRYVAFTRFYGLFITKTIVNHHTWIWEKPLKNHRCQWSICKKTFNGDGQGVAKPLKNHRWQWCPEEKTLPSHRLKKMIIAEVYCPPRERFQNTRQSFGWVGVWWGCPPSSASKGCPPCSSHFAHHGHLAWARNSSTIFFWLASQAELLMISSW